MKDFDKGEFWKIAVGAVLIFFGMNLQLKLEAEGKSLLSWVIGGGLFMAGWFVVYLNLVVRQKADGSADERCFGLKRKHVAAIAVIVLVVGVVVAAQALQGKISIKFYWPAIGLFWLGFLLLGLLAPILRNECSIQSFVLVFAPIVTIIVATNINNAASNVENFPKILGMLTFLVGWAGFAATQSLITNSAPKTAE